VLHEARPSLPDGQRWSLEAICPPPSSYHTYPSTGRESHYQQRVQKLKAKVDPLGIIYVKVDSDNNEKDHGKLYMIVII
jgi:hypothetical protein